MANEKPGMKNIMQTKRNGVLFQQYTNSQGNIVREAFDGNGKRLAKGIMDSEGGNFNVKPISNLDISNDKSSYAVNTLSMERGLFVPKKKTNSPIKTNKTSPIIDNTNKVGDLKARKAGLVDNINSSNLTIRKANDITPINKKSNNVSNKNIKSIRQEIRVARKENRLEDKIDRTKKKELRLTEKLNKLKGGLPQARKGGVVGKITSKKPLVKSTKLVSKKINVIKKKK